MFVGDVRARTLEEAARFRKLTYTCMDTWYTRQPETIAFPERPCKEVTMTSLRFPTCWDGKNLDSPDHMSHMSYPETGTFESGGPCPSTHPIRTGQVMFEVVWDTKPYNNMTWKDGKNPFVWSFGDGTGYANHADYVFGWKGDTLLRILDTYCYFDCTKNGFNIQSIPNMNKCSQQPVVEEDIDGCMILNAPSNACLPFSEIRCFFLLFPIGLPSLPGGAHAEYS